MTKHLKAFYTFVIDNMKVYRQHEGIYIHQVWRAPAMKFSISSDTS